MFVIARYPEVAKSGGWSSLPHELFESSDAFFAKHGLSAVAWPYRHWMAGLGYGFHSEMPALYSMSFIGRGLLLKMLRTVFDLDSGFRTVAPGLQKLCEAVARDLDIRLNHPVTAVRRRAKGQGWTIHVTSNGQTETFDRLITTVSHPRMLEVLDPSEAERAVYGRIRFNPYVTTVFRARGLGLPC